jgi:fermentation-respiration switch protein FrsA (DUF1100 family)
VGWLQVLLRVALILAACYLALAALLFLVQDKLIYPAPRGGARDPRDAGLEGGEALEVVTSDGVRLHGWFLWASPSRARGAPTLLVFHGNGENLTNDAPWHDLLRLLGCNVAAIDYRGYGLSEGSPSEAGLIEDGFAALRAVRARPDVDPAKIVLLGSSIGSGVAVAVAAREEVAGVILQSPFDSLRTVALRHYPIFPGFLVRSPFESRSRIGGVRAPVLVLHGDRDTIVPIESGRALYAAAPRGMGFHVVEGAGHNDLETVAGASYGLWIREFLAAISPTSAR